MTDKLQQIMKILFILVILIHLTESVRKIHDVLEWRTKRDASFNNCDEFSKNKENNCLQEALTQIYKIQNTLREGYVDNARDLTKSCYDFRKQKCNGFVSYGLDCCINENVCAIYDTEWPKVESAWEHMKQVIKTYAKVSVQRFIGN